MKRLLCDFNDKYGRAWPFLLLFLTTLFLPTASNRIVFYLLTPFLLFTLYDLRHQATIYLKTWSFFAVSLYLFYFFLTFFWSELQVTENFLRLLRDIASIVIFTMSLAMILPRTRLPERLPLYFGCVCVLWAAAAAAYTYLWGGHGLNYRLEGFGRFENSIHMAFLMSFSIIGLFCYAMTKPGIEKKDAALLTFLGLSLIFFIALTQTRSAYIALIACGGAMLLLGHIRYVALILGGILIAFLCLYCFSDSYISSFMGRMDSHRFEIWEEAYEGIVEKPLLGHGIATEPAFYLEAKDAKRGWKSPHNVVLGHLYTGGILGLLTFALLALNMCRVSVKEYLRERREKSVRFVTYFTILTICFALTASLFNLSHYVIGVHIHWLVFWVPFALTWMLEAGQKTRAASC